MTLTLYLALIVGVIASAILTWLAFVNAIQGVWHLGAVLVLRQRSATLTALLLALLIGGPFMLLTGSTQVEAYLTLFVLLAPLPIYWLVSWFSWRSASSEERQAAYVIRQELAERFNETPPKAGRWWPGYVYDTERAKRREAYEAPPV